MLQIDAPKNNQLYAAAALYGLDSFSFELLLECMPEELNQKEKYFIELYNADAVGYNQVKGMGQNEALGKPNDERVLYALYLSCPRVPVSRNRRVVFVTVDRTPTGRSDLFYARIPRAAADNVLIGGAHAMPFVPRLSM